MQLDLLRVLDLGMNEVPIVAQYDTYALSRVTNPPELVTHFDVIVQRPVLKRKGFAMALRSSSCVKQDAFVGKVVLLRDEERLEKAAHHDHSRQMCAALQAGDAL